MAGYPGRPGQGPAPPPSHDGNAHLPGVQQLRPFSDPAKHQRAVVAGGAAAEADAVLPGGHGRTVFVRGEQEHSAGIAQGAKSSLHSELARRAFQAAGLQGGVPPPPPDAPHDAPPGAQPSQPGASAGPAPYSLPSHAAKGAAPGTSNPVRPAFVQPNKPMVANLRLPGKAPASGPTRVVLQTAGARAPPLRQPYAEAAPPPPPPPVAPTPAQSGAGAGGRAEAADAAVGAQKETRGEPGAGATAGAVGPVKGPSSGAAVGKGAGREQSRAPEASASRGRGDAAGDGPKGAEVPGRDGRGRWGGGGGATRDRDPASPSSPESLRDADVQERNDGSRGERRDGGGDGRDGGRERGTGRGGDVQGGLQEGSARARDSRSRSPGAAGGGAHSSRDGGGGDRRGHGDERGVGDKRGVVGSQDGARKGGAEVEEGEYVGREEGGERRGGRDRRDGEGGPRGGREGEDRGAVAGGAGSVRRSASKEREQDDGAGERAHRDARDWSRERRHEDAHYAPNSQDYDRHYDREYDRGHDRYYERHYDRHYDRDYDREYDRHHDRHYDRDHGRDYGHDGHGRSSHRSRSVSRDRLRGEGRRGRRGDRSLSPEPGEIRGRGEGGEGDRRDRGRGDGRDRDRNSRKESKRERERDRERERGRDKERGRERERRGEGDGSRERQGGRRRSRWDVGHEGGGGDRDRHGADHDSAAMDRQGRARGAGSHVGRDDGREVGPAPAPSLGHPGHHRDHRGTGASERGARERGEAESRGVEGADQTVVSDLSSLGSPFGEIASGAAESAPQSARGGRGWTGPVVTPGAPPHETPRDAPGVALTEEEQADMMRRAASDRAERLARGARAAGAGSVSGLGGGAVAEAQGPSPEWAVVDAAISRIFGDVQEGLRDCLEIQGSEERKRAINSLAAEVSDRCVFRSRDAQDASSLDARGVNPWDLTSRGLVPRVARELAADVHSRASVPGVDGRAKDTPQGRPHGLRVEPVAIPDAPRPTAREPRDRASYASTRDAPCALPLPRFSLLAAPLSSVLDVPREAFAVDDPRAPPSHRRGSLAGDAGTAPPSPGDASPAHSWSSLPVSPRSQLRADAILGFAVPDGAQGLAYGAAPTAALPPPPRGGPVPRQGPLPDAPRPWLVPPPDAQPAPAPRVAFGRGLAAQAAADGPGGARPVQGPGQRGSRGEVPPSAPLPPPPPLPLPPSQGAGVPLPLPLPPRPSADREQGPRAGASVSAEGGREVPGATGEQGREKAPASARKGKLPSQDPAADMRRRPEAERDARAANGGAVANRGAGGEGRTAAVAAGPERAGRGPGEPGGAGRGGAASTKAGAQGSRRSEGGSSLLEQLLTDKPGISKGHAGAVQPQPHAGAPPSHAAGAAAEVGGAAATGTSVGPTGTSVVPTGASVGPAVGPKAADGSGGPERMTGSVPVPAAVTMAAAEAKPAAQGEGGGASRSPPPQPLAPDALGATAAGAQGGDSVAAGAADRPGDARALPKPAGASDEAPTGALTEAAAGAAAGAAEARATGEAPQAAAPVHAGKKGYGRQGKRRTGEGNTRAAPPSVPGAGGGGGGGAGAGPGQAAGAAGGTRATRAGAKRNAPEPSQAAAGKRARTSKQQPKGAEDAEDATGAAGAAAGAAGGDGGAEAGGAVPGAALVAWLSAEGKREAEVAWARGVLGKDAPGPAGADAAGPGAPQGADYDVLRTLLTTKAFVMVKGNPRKAPMRRGMEVMFRSVEALVGSLAGAERAAVEAAVGGNTAAGVLRWLTVDRIKGWADGIDGGWGAGRLSAHRLLGVCHQAMTAFHKGWGVVAAAWVKAAPINENATDLKDGVSAFGSRVNNIGRFVNSADGLSKFLAEEENRPAGKKEEEGGGKTTGRAKKRQGK